MLLDLFISDVNDVAWLLAGLLVLAIPIGIVVLLLLAIQRATHPATRLALSFVLLLLVFVGLAHLLA